VVTRKRIRRGDGRRDEENGRLQSKAKRGKKAKARRLQPRASIRATSRTRRPRSGRPHRHKLLAEAERRTRTRVGGSWPRSAAGGGHRRKPGQPGEHVRCVVGGDAQRGLGTQQCHQHPGRPGVRQPTAVAAGGGARLRRMDYTPNPETDSYRSMWMSTDSLLVIPYKDAQRRNRNPRTSRRINVRPWPSVSDWRCAFLWWRATPSPCDGI